MGVVHPIFEPDTVSMLAHVEHLFGGFLDGFHDGLVELAWTQSTPNAEGRYPLNQAAFFRTDQLEELVEKAAALNSVPMCNVYIGAALRHPDTFPGKRAGNEDAWCLTSVYSDFDDHGAATGAKDKWADAKPTFIVRTGNVPHTRAQPWWRLTTPISDPDQWSALLRGMAVAMGGDTTVCNPGRVMRLAGSIAWPVKDGRTTELTAVVHLRNPGLAAYSPEQMAAKWPPINEMQAEAAGIDTSGVTRGTGAFGFEGEVTDGRDAYMMRTVLAVLVEYIGENGTVPEPQELFDLAWPQFAAHADMTRPGHNTPELMRKKVQYALQRFARGQIKGARTLEEAVASYEEKERRRPFDAGAEAQRQEQRAAGESGLLLTGAEFVARFRPPEYLIDGIMQRGYLYSLTARTGHGKTAVALYACQGIARALNVHGRKVKPGTVIFCAGENSDDIRARWIVLADRMGFDISTTPVRFIDGVIDIKASTPRIVAEADAVGDVVLIVVDTAAAYFNGDDPNNNAQQVAFARDLRALTATIASRPAVLVNCHPVKNAARDNLIPMGGSALLNEVDGNLTLWSNGDGQTTLHWQGKFRGPEFEPLTFKIETAHSKRVVDSDGREMPSVVATPMGEIEQVFAEKEAETDENVLLAIIGHNRGASIADMARKAGWVSASGIANKAKVYRVAERLLEAKLVKRHRNSKYAITEAGKAELGWGEE